MNVITSYSIHYTKLYDICVDTRSWSRLDQRLSVLSEKSDLDVIVWDHHEEGDMNARESHLSQTGAAVTLLVQQIEKERKLITPIQATLFLIGLYEDTGHLSYPSTCPEDAYAAGFLLDRKADLNILGTFLHVITSYSIHYTKLYDMNISCRVFPREYPLEKQSCKILQEPTRITSYNVCYTKLLRP